jgi:uncharacterized phage-like protein YoqJ
MAFRFHLEQCLAAPKLGGLFVIITGIAHSPQRLLERSLLPSNELVYLASKALKVYDATRLITSLELGWEQALAKAAVELKIPFVVAFPFPGRDSTWDREIRILYYELLSRADEVYQVNDTFSETSLYECRCWQTDQADLVLALWDYEFDNDTVFDAIHYALDKDVKVTNLWQDWFMLNHLRKKNQPEIVSRHKGAQVY